MSSSSSSTTNTDKQAQKWSQTVSSYVRYFEPSGLVLGRFMLNCLKLQFVPPELSILEAGAGAGGLAKELCQLAAVNISKLYVTDISDGMLEAAHNKLNGISSDKIVIEKADFTKFDYPDDMLDRYYANLCLHYAEDPIVVIKEASRVLKTGGIAGFTVWGRSQESPLMTIVPNVLDELGLVPKDSSKRSSFHLGEDDDKLRNMFLTNGFQKCTLVHYPAVMECLDASAYVELIIDGAASTKKQVESFTAEQQTQIRQEVYKRAKTILEKGEPMSMDMIVIIAQK